jgi:hypothetical protein
MFLHSKHGSPARWSVHGLVSSAPMGSVTWCSTRVSFSEASPALKLRNLKFRGREGLPKQTQLMRWTLSERARGRETEKHRERQEGKERERCATERDCHVYAHFRFFVLKLDQSSYGTSVAWKRSILSASAMKPSISRSRFTSVVRMAWAISYVVSLMAWESQLVVGS